MLPTAIPVMLAQVEGLFAIVIFVIAFFSWVANLKSQHQPPQRRNPGQRREGQGQREVQQEVDEFLNQSRRNRQRGGGEAAGRDEIEVLEPPRKRPARRPPPQGQPRSRNQREIWEEQVRGETEGPRADAPRPVAGSRTSRQPQRRPAAATQQQQQRPASRSITPPPAASPPVSIQKSVSSHLGTFGAAAPTALGQRALLETTADRPGPAAVLRALLQSRDGVRNAILMTEILSKPRALR